VFWLARIEGHRQVHIATLLGISLNMVERHLIRALLDLRTARDVLSS
jgi:RNA polymerase sigma-70 factor (ECF subfamily)